MAVLARSPKRTSFWIQHSRWIILYKSIHWLSRLRHSLIQWWLWHRTFPQGPEELCGLPGACVRRLWPQAIDSFRSLRMPGKTFTHVWVAECLRGPRWPSSKGCCPLDMNLFWRDRDTFSGPNGIWWVCAILYNYNYLKGHIWIHSWPMLPMLVCKAWISWEWHGGTRPRSTFRRFRIPCGMWSFGHLCAIGIKKTWPYHFNIK